MKSSDRTKLIIGVVILVIAGGVIAWNAGIFGGNEAPSTPPPVDPAKPPSGGPRAMPGAK